MIQAHIDIYKRAIHEAFNYICWEVLDHCKILQTGKEMSIQAHSTAG